MRIRNIIFIVLLILLLSSFYKMKFHPIESAFLIPKEELIHTNIENIEITNRRTNDRTVIEDMVGIEKIASYLLELNTESTDSFDYSDITYEPIYEIYITNNGKYTNAAIIVFENSMVYRGKLISITSKDLLLITRLLDNEIGK